MNKKINKSYKISKLPLSLFIILAIIFVLAGILNILVFNDDDYSKKDKLAIEECKSICYKYINDTNFVNGPCLSENILDEYSCDVIHNPKIDFIDNKKENQCQNYKRNKLILLDKSCNFIEIK